MQTEKDYSVGREIHGLRCESVGEYSLPDYNGDVKKILLIKSKVFPAGKFVGEDSLEFSGTVGYEVVYVDAENSVTHAEFSTDYDAAVKVDSASYIDSDVKTSVSHCNMRLIGPRKLSVKCALESDVRISEKRIYSVDGDAFMDRQPEYTEQSAMIYTSSFAFGEARRIDEELISIEGAIADEVEVLLSEVRASVDSCDVDDGHAHLKCRADMTLLYRNGENVPKKVDKEITFAEEIEVDADLVDSVIEARIEAADLKAAVSPTEEGVSLTVSVTAHPIICARRNARLDVITDAYLKERGTENEYGEFSYTEHICSESVEEKYEADHDSSELDLPGDAEVLYSDASVRIEECEIVGDTVKVSGEIRFSGIAVHVTCDGDTIYTPIKITDHFAKNVNINCQTHDNLRVNCHANADDVKLEIDNSLLKASCTLGIFLNVCSERRQRCLGSSYATDEEYIKDDSVVTVYYPDSSESLFDIARKFHTSVSAIAQSNRLSESVFMSVRQPVGAHGLKKLLIK